MRPVLVYGPMPHVISRPVAPVPGEIYLAFLELVLDKPAVVDKYFPVKYQ
jgi:hypothetical protein